MGLKFSGSDALKKALRAKQDLGPIKKVIKNNGAEMQNTAMRLAPVDTGNLKRNIHLAVVDNGMAVIISSDAKYAVYQEYGTRYQSGKPHIRPAFKQQWPVMVADLTKLMR